MTLRTERAETNGIVTIFWLDARGRLAGSLSSRLRENDGAFKASLNGSSPVSCRTLVRNVALLPLAGVVAWKADEIPSAWPAVSGDSSETAMAAAIGALAVVRALTWWFLFRMLQQNGWLLLFWNPSCGFCQKMLPDVKAWKPC